MPGQSKMKKEKDSLAELGLDTSEIDWTLIPGRLLRGVPAGPKP